MDLKDVITEVTQDIKEAQDAYNAGHPETAVKHLNGIYRVIQANIAQTASPAGDVTESATSETPDATEQEKPAEVPGAALPATQFGSADAAQQIGQGQAEQKQPQ